MSANLLLNEHPLVVLPSLARALHSSDKALIVQQVHYWCKHNQHSKRNYHDGQFWTYNSIQNWRDNYFDWLSYDTVKRHFSDLEREGWIISGCFNADPRDKTKWYRVNYETIERAAQCISAKCTNGLVQNAPTITRDLPEENKQTNTVVFFSLDKWGSIVADLAHTDYDLAMILDKATPELINGDSIVLNFTSKADYDRWEKGIWNTTALEKILGVDHIYFDARLVDTADNDKFLQDVLGDRYEELKDKVIKGAE